MPKRKTRRPGESPSPARAVISNPTANSSSSSLDSDVSSRSAADKKRGGHNPYDVGNFWANKDRWGHKHKPYMDAAVKVGNLVPTATRIEIRKRQDGMAFEFVVTAPVIPKEVRGKIASIVDKEMNDAGFEYKFFNAVCEEAGGTT